MNYEQHPLSAAWPSMSQAAFNELTADIKAHGQHDPGVLLDGMVLDGWHRCRACFVAGIEFQAVEFEGDDPAAFVISKNKHRRHITAGQIAVCAAACTNWRPVGRPENSAAAALLEGKTLQEAAKQVGVSRRTMAQAKVVIKAGLGDAVKDGKVSVERAAEIAKLPPKQREKALKEPPKPKKSDARDAEIVRLKDELEQMGENLPELRAMASAAAVFENDEQFKKIMQLEAELTSVKRSRDDYMRQCVELKKQVKYWKRQSEKAAA